MNITKWRLTPLLICKTSLGTLAWFWELFWELIAITKAAGTSTDTTLSVSKELFKLAAPIR